jgi:hypothetical protein
MVSSGRNPDSREKIRGNQDAAGTVNNPVDKREWFRNDPRNW